MGNYMSGYEDQECSEGLEADPQQVRRREELMRQIKNSNLRLNIVITAERCGIPLGVAQGEELDHYYHQET